MIEAPRLPGSLRKNDALFMYGALQKKPFVFTYLQNDVEIVGGPSCRREREINTRRCARDRIAIIERRGGGGTVVLAPGMVITVVVDERPPAASATDIFNLIHDCMIGLLGATGISNIKRCGISDLAIDDKKILGSSLYLGNRPFLYYYQSSLLVNPDMRLLARYLKHPPREPGYRNGRHHEDFCTSISERGFAPTPQMVRNLFTTRLGAHLKTATAIADSSRSA